MTNVRYTPLQRKIADHKTTLALIHKLVAKAERAARNRGFFGVDRQRLRQELRALETHLSAYRLIHYLFYLDQIFQQQTRDHHCERLFKHPLFLRLPRLCHDLASQLFPFQEPRKTLQTLRECRDHPECLDAAFKPLYHTLYRSIQTFKDQAVIKYPVKSIVERADLTAQRRTLTQHIRILLKQLIQALTPFHFNELDPIRSQPLSSTVQITQPTVAEIISLTPRDCEALRGQLGTLKHSTSQRSPHGLLHPLAQSENRANPAMQHTERRQAHTLSTTPDFIALYQPPIGRQQCG